MSKYVAFILHIIFKFINRSIELDMNFINRTFPLDLDENENRNINLHTKPRFSLTIIVLSMVLHL